MPFSADELRRFGKRYGAVKPDYYYEHYAAHLALEPAAVTNVLELGIYAGGSLLMWRDFFPNARIFGVDTAQVAVPPTIDRVFTLQADQGDGAAIGAFLQMHHVETVDLVIDDASHMGLPTKRSFEFLFDRYLKPGGYYVIEDWGTGYSGSWHDGAPLEAPKPGLEEQGVFTSHQNGIPGFVKQLVDRSELFESMVVTGAFVALHKEGGANRDAIDRAVRLWTEQHQV